MSRHMTREGYDAILKEIEQLWNYERPVMVQQVAEAAAQGDRSENAEYIYGKKRLRQIDSRMRFLNRKVQDVEVVDLDQQEPSDHVRFGALVQVEDEDGVQKQWRLVDKDESDPKRGRISVQSPIGMALLNRRVGDVVEAKLPKGSVELEILRIHYGAESKSP
jgi:transcription elongation factor GreB